MSYKDVCIKLLKPEGLVGGGEGLEENCSQSPPPPPFDVSMPHESTVAFSGWRCEVCDLQENIWMNLTDGKVLCGRRYFDGSGGNNHALLHFQETRYPLAVKLGTITPDGAGVLANRTQIPFLCGREALKRSRTRLPEAWW